MKAGRAGAPVVALGNPLDPDLGSQIRHPKPLGSGSSPAGYPGEQGHVAGEPAAGICAGLAVGWEAAAVAGELAAGIGAGLDVGWEAAARADGSAGEVG
jgi:hypothetical protein